jgi:hypothetical protein
MKKIPKNAALAGPRRSSSEERVTPTIPRAETGLAIAFIASWVAIVACSPPMGNEPSSGDINLDTPPRTDKPADAGEKDAGGKQAPPEVSTTRAPSHPNGKTVEAGKAGWLFDGYCGNEALGACEAGVPECAGEADAITGSSCTRTLDHCLGPANEANVRKRYLCTEKAIPAWIFNGYCDSDPTVPCVPGGAKPACTDNAPAGSECASPSTKCVSGASIFVCVAGAKNAWLTSGHCGVESAGEKSCADGAQPVCKDIYGGKPCDPLAGIRCQSTGSSNEPGKVFSCVVR